MKIINIWLTKLAAWILSRLSPGAVPYSLYRELRRHTVQANVEFFAYVFTDPTGGGMDHHAEPEFLFYERPEGVSCAGKLVPVGTFLLPGENWPSSDFPMGTIGRALKKYALSLGSFTSVESLGVCSGIRDGLGEFVQLVYSGHIDRRSSDLRFQGQGKIWGFCIGELRGMAAKKDPRIAEHLWPAIDLLLNRNKGSRCLHDLRRQKNVVA
ncbi:MAG: hypothetical protein Q8Q06_02690 [bacterium]|nr:hypothetical protein [bacterium]